MTDAILTADRISMHFDTPEGRITAVDDVSFDVRPGEFLSVIGPSGCGKSTLFNVIGGLLGGHEGTVQVAGETIDGPHKSIGMVFQEESTFPWRTVVDNVAFPLELTGMARAAFHLAGRARRFRKPISGRIVRRHAPAGVARPHARIRAEDTADGRTLCRARRDHPPQAQ